MDSENGRMTREEYRAQMGLDVEPNAKREKSGDAGARLILLQLIICAAAISSPVWSDASPVNGSSRLPNGELTLPLTGICALIVV